MFPDSFGIICDNIVVRGVQGAPEGVFLTLEAVQSVQLDGLLLMTSGSPSKEHYWNGRIAHFLYVHCPVGTVMGNEAEGGFEDR